jgi:hypothetical protein
MTAQLPVVVARLAFNVFNVLSGDFVRPVFRSA